MIDKLGLRNRRGFTLIEMIAVMIILSIVVSVAIQKFDTISDTAAEQALKAGERELNVREALTWTDIKISSAGWASDEEVFGKMDTDLGPDYRWNPGPTADGGTLHFRSRPKVLNRIHSSFISAGNWY
jgi:prepilin-type N-terminal cleavage/methylation domain-containing protein